ncbi:MAG: hypothetical protein LBK55_11370 [Azoarcus sp.]|jgi:hypothetical protein|nr:hypothetical protein [Azoarcus sp.]
MPKSDFPALLQPGVHSLSLQELHDMAVAPFPADAQRLDLYQKLAMWIGALQACGVIGTLWVDGSFLTEKLGPDDIDCVLWNPDWASLASATPANARQISHLLDRTTAENLYGLDLYVVKTALGDVFHEKAYWRGVLGFGHDRVTAKGFAEVCL